METIERLEVTIAKWYENMPHLPKNGQKWLASNAWWLVLIGVILSTLGIMGFLMLVLLSSALLTGVAGVAGAAIGGIALLASLVYFVFSIIEIILSIMAISPLKALRKKGWTLLFTAMLVNVLAFVIGFIFSFNVFSLLRELVAVGIGMYFLFEVRDYFVLARHTTKTAKK